MNEDLRRRYVRDLLGDLEQVGGIRFEQWIPPLWDKIAGAPVQARGQNREGMSVGGEFDGDWPDGSASEASSDKAYFQHPFAKAKGDVGHVLKLRPDVRTIRLFSNRQAPQGTIEALHSSVARCHGEEVELDVWDGRRIAEYIVDELLTDDSYVARVGTALPNLRRIAEQNAVSRRVPTQCVGFGGREVEELEVKRRLTVAECVVLWGLSGVGKTQLAVAVAESLRDEFEMVIWVAASEIGAVEELGAVDVRNNGYVLNIEGLLKRKKVLLVLDDVTVDLEVGRLASLCGESRVIMTSQSAFGPQTLEVGFVGRRHALSLLARELADGCPERVVDRALELFGGHPLVLELLNRQAVADGHWETVEQDFASMLGDTSANRETVARRLLMRHAAVKLELSMFAWCDSPSVDAQFFHSCCGAQGVRKLRDRAMTVATQDDRVQLHGLVYSAIARLRAEDELAINEDWCESQLAEYITKAANPKGLAFFRVVNRHAGLVTRLLERSREPGAIRYAYLHGCTLDELRSDLLGSPESDVRTVLEGGCERMAVLSLVEAIELDYRRARVRDEQVAKNVLEGRLAIYQQLACEELGIGVGEVVRHHRAKSLLKLGREDEARAAFLGLVDSVEVGFQAKLQVARLSKKEPEKALALILSIIVAERETPGTVAMSVLLEAFATLRRGFLRPSAGRVEDDYREYMAQQIMAAACSGEDQPIRTFAAVGVDWAYKDAQLFLRVLDEIEIGRPADAEDDGERVAVGQVLAAAGKLHLREGKNEEAEDRFKEADEFYSAIAEPTAFARTQHADTLIRLGRTREAETVLEQVSEARRESFWRLRRAEVHRASAELAEALSCVDVALEDPLLGPRRTTFLELRGEILFDMGDPVFADAFREAIEMSDDTRNTKRLERRLEVLERDACAW